MWLRIGNTVKINCNMERLGIKSERSEIIRGPFVVGDVIMNFKGGDLMVYEIKEIENEYYRCTIYGDAGGVMVELEKEYADNNYRKL